MTIHGHDQKECPKILPWDIPGNDLSCILFINLHVIQESHSGSRGIALRSEGKNLKKTEIVNRMKGVRIDDENAVKVSKI